MHRIQGTVRKSGSEAKRFVLVAYDNTIDLHNNTGTGWQCVDDGGDGDGGRTVRWWFKRKL